MGSSEVWKALCPTDPILRLTNAFGVKYFGEAEFWLSGGKLILILLLYCFTFVTMCGGNPQKDAYGFRNWTKPVR